MSKKIVIEVHFINGDRISDKGYQYTIQRDCYDIVLEEVENCKHINSLIPCFHITNKNGYNYRNAKVVITQATVVESFGENFSLVDIVGVEYADLILADKTWINMVKNLKSLSELNPSCEKAKVCPIITKNNDEKENNMFENVFKNVKFGKADGVNMSIYGPAFPSEKDGKSYISYHDEKWVDVTGLLLDMNFCYMMPVAKDNVSLEDYILHNDSWVRVIDLDDAGRLIVEKLESQEVVTILPTTNVFGFDFYTKLFTPNDIFGGTNCGASAENPFGMLPMMMMMMQDKGSRGNDSMMEMFMMASMMGGNASFNPMMLMLMGDHKNSDMKDFMMMSMMMGNNPFDMSANK